MTKEEFDFVLAERKQKIIVMDSQWNLEKKSYLALSGGKDSVVVHYLLDLALPNNNIPRVFVNTGIEYKFITDFVKQLAEKDKRINIIQPQRNIKETLEKYGYPFKSKEHSNKVYIYRNSGLNSKTVSDYLDDNKKQNYKCPSFLKYQFTPENKLKISDMCCKKLKKEPSKKWQTENDRTITMTGMRSEEGGQRKNKQCSSFYIRDDKNARKGELKNFHPIFYMGDEWVDMFVKEYKIELCKLYYPPYNFKRTGCKGCPFNLKLEKDLYTMELLLPNERKQCELIWKPVYDEYRRIGYRLKNTSDDFSIFDW